MDFIHVVKVLSNVPYLVRTIRNNVRKVTFKTHVNILPYFGKQT